MCFSPYHYTITYIKLRLSGLLTYQQLIAIHLFQVYQLVKDQLHQHKMRALHGHRDPVLAAVMCHGALLPELNVRGDERFLQNQIVL